MRWLAILVAAIGWGQTFEATPAVVQQGETIRVRDAGAAASARMSGRTVRLFPQAEGGRLGLMPVAAGTAPGSYQIEFLGDNGRVLHAGTITVRDARLRTQNVVMGKEIQELQPSPGETETVAEFRKTVSETRRWVEPLAAPVPGCMISPFGVKRLHNGKPTGDYHGGVDQRSPAGRPVRAVAGGVVKIVRKFNLRGGTVAVDHGQGLESIYLHLSGFAAVEGAVVNKGDVVGYVGSTGRSTGAHLHWALYVNGVPVNPAQWVPLGACPTGKRKGHPHS
ncbi:MAG: peptidoglycan DD-metalloendopeptidase family protein [Bryobacteraceae bacterium]|jgi:murein DD-endopeptidase MepM/ murein hydrolase activator NlpD